MYKSLISIAFVFLPTLVYCQVVFKDLPSQHKIEVIIDGKLFTNYYYPGKELLKKAVLFPIFTPQGTVVTRGWPIEPVAGERVDHPHHVGAWLNYEDVNGHDFWNNSTEVQKSGDKRTFGTIVHTGKIKMINGKKKGKLIVQANWLDKNNEIMLTEKTTYTFRKINGTFIADRQTKLKATDKKVVFKDVKDGFFAIRVRRELEMPSLKPEIFSDAKGLASTVPLLDNTNVVGNYINSEGVEGEKTWGLRSNWVSLQGKVKEEDISVTIIDHPTNVGYPAYWHTRGYGLFSVNPLGQNVFSNGKENLNFTLSPNQSVEFKYRLAISSKKLKSEEINELTTDFVKSY